MLPVANSVPNTYGLIGSVISVCLEDTPGI